MGVAAEPLVLNVAGGAQLCVPHSLEGITPYVLLEQEDWFEDEIRFVRRWLRPGMRAIDIGASFGAYTVAMARAAGPAGRVWAYEPTEGAAGHLERSLALNGCTGAQVMRAAVTDAPGRLAFVASEHSEISSIAGEGAPRGEPRELPAVTLDAEAEARGWDEVDFVKLDIEGHEHAALRGGAGFLERASPLVLFEIAHRGAFDRRALEVLLEAGYRAFRLLPGPLVLAPFDPLEALDPFQLNLFACKEDRAARLAADGFLLLPEAPAAPPLARSEAWPEFARGAPYARELAPHWPEPPGWLAAEDRKLHAQALASFARSQDDGAPAAARVAHLAQALACARQALLAKPTLARRLTYARLAWMLGFRQAAAEVLAEALGSIDPEAEAARAEPFLAPSERYQRTPGAGQPGWLRCAATEQHERLRDLSSFYSGARSLEVLEPIRALPFRSPEVDRRRNLVRLRERKLAAPEPGTLLERESEENLNPRYWSR